MNNNTELVDLIGDVEFVYVGIGSVPWTDSIDMYTDRTNQLVPVFVRDQIKYHKSVSILHFDPNFLRNGNMEFTDTYIKKTFPEIDRREPNYWCMPNLEIRIIPERFEHEESNFLEQLGHQLMGRGAQLVVQEFTGTELIPYFKQVFARAANPAFFKKSILYDITYGNECGCGTDMSKWKPLYDNYGNFVNLALFTEDELEEQLHGLPNELILPLLIRKYRDSISLHHVNYRRRVQGLDVMHKTILYDNTVTPDTIMGIIQKDLTFAVRMLRKLGLVSDEELGQFTSIMATYKDHDMYSWLSLVMGFRFIRHL
jgi:hypothetical protein